MGDTQQLLLNIAPQDSAIRIRNWGLSDRFREKKELTDLALKLAEVGKAKSNWESQGILRLAAFVVLIAPTSFQRLYILK